MSMTDPIADMLTRIRNAQLAGHSAVSMPFSKIKLGIAEVLKKEGYILEHHAEKANEKMSLKVILKYYEGNRVISTIKRVSQPGRRVYKSCKELRPVPGLGIAILSTPRGLMSDRDARKQNLGGEVLCEVA